jgi:nitrous oxidase accessory protein
MELRGRGNFWSDHPAFDLNGDGIADSVYRPNDLMDQILWSQPAAALLTGSPAVQLVRWSQQRFPGHPAGRRHATAHPLMRPLTIPVPADIAALRPRSPDAGPKEIYDDIDPDDLTAH